MANENAVTETPKDAKRVPMATVKSENGVLTFKFRHGAEHAVNVAEMSQDLRDKLAAHGAEQKLRDSYAGSGGNSENAEAAFLKVLDAFNRGDFTVRRAEGESKEEPTEVLARAIEAALAAAGKPKPRAIILVGLANMDKNARAAYRRNPEVAAQLARIRAESSAKPVTLDSIGDAFNETPTETPAETPAQ